LFVLIVGGRYGTQVGNGRSVTNLEYLEAKRKELPIYVFVTTQILHALPIWKANPESNFQEIVDSKKLFEFVDAVRGVAGHWVYPFDDVVHITEVLRHQWALLFTDAMAQRERLRVAKLSPELMNLDIRPLRVLLEKPFGWEYRFFSVALRCELDGLAGLRRDLQYGLLLGPVKRLGDLPEIAKWVLPQLERMKRFAISAEALTHKALVEALGPSGQPGNPELLLYVAQRVSEIVRQALQWTQDFTSMDVDDEFRRLLELTSNFSRNIIEKIDSLPQLIDAEMDKADAASSRGETYSGKILLVLDMPYTPELADEIDRLRLREMPR
jgi:hypothetical protein